MTTNSTDNDGQGMIVNPRPTADNQDWDGDEADRADRLRFEEEQAMIREQFGAIDVIVECGDAGPMTAIGSLRCALPFDPNQE